MEILLWEGFAVGPGARGCYPRSLRGWLVMKAKLAQRLKRPSSSPRVSDPRARAGEHNPSRTPSLPCPGLDILQEVVSAGCKWVLRASLPLGHFTRDGAG